MAILGSVSCDAVRRARLDFEMGEASRWGLWQAACQATNGVPSTFSRWVAHIRRANCPALVAPLLQIARHSGRSQRSGV